VQTTDPSPRFLDTASVANSGRPLYGRRRSHPAFAPASKSPSTPPRLRCSRDPKPRRRMYWGRPISVLSPKSRQPADHYASRSFAGNAAIAMRLSYAPADALGAVSRSRRPGRNPLQYELRPGTSQSARPPSSHFDSARNRQAASSPASDCKVSFISARPCFIPYHRTAGNLLSIAIAVRGELPAVFIRHHLSQTDCTVTLYVRAHRNRGGALAPPSIAPKSFVFKHSSNPPTAATCIFTGDGMAS